MSKFPENTKFRTSVEFKNRLTFLIDDYDCKTNKEFANLVGVSEPVISKAINFCIVPTTRILIKIANKFELSLKYLLGLSDTNDFIISATPTTFTNRLKELINENKITCSHLAYKMNFPRNYIYEWKKENTLPSIDYILDMANYFKVSPDYLLGRTDYRN